MTKKTHSHRKLALWIAKRYLFSKKSHNAVNIISAISAIGVCVGTMALIVVLSVFNGFEQLIEKMFSTFDPDLEIVHTTQNRFVLTATQREEIAALSGVYELTEVVQEAALVKYGNRQMPVSLMGVGRAFDRVTDIDSIIQDGEFMIDTLPHRTVLGIGIAAQLGLYANAIDPISIHVPKRTKKINIVRPETSINSSFAYVSGIFMVSQPEYDDRLVLLSLTQARQLFDYEENMVTSLYVRLEKDADVLATQKKIETLLGEEYQALDQYQQHQAYFKFANIEKWMTYLILSFILMIAIFNIIGSLSLLMIEKKADMRTLRSLGGTDGLIRNIFLMEGSLIAVLGALLGAFLGVLVVLLQQYFGLIKLDESIVIVDAYPIALSLWDVLVVLVTVVMIVFLAVAYTVRQLSNRYHLK